MLSHSHQQNALFSSQGNQENSSVVLGDKENATPSAKTPAAGVFKTPARRALGNITNKTPKTGPSARRAFGDIVKTPKTAGSVKKQLSDRKKSKPLSVQSVGRPGRHVHSQIHSQGQEKE